MLKVLDLFSGIGGFSLGLDRSGMRTIAFCEIEKYPRSILKKHWPDVPIANDIKKLSYNFKTKQLFYKTKVIYVGSIELICGGFPCQPFSFAGKRRGKEDDRHLWPEMLRLIKEVRPTWVIGENVAGIIGMAFDIMHSKVESKTITRDKNHDYYEEVLTRQETMCLDSVCKNLEEQRYNVQPFVIPACAIGAVHRRDRVWIVAHSEFNTGFDSLRRINGKSKNYEEEFRKENRTTRKSSRTSHNGVSSNEHASNSNRPTNGKQRKHEESSQSNNSQRKIHDVAYPKCRGRSEGSQQTGRKTREEANGCCGKTSEIMANTNNGKSSRQRSISSEVLRNKKTRGCNELCGEESKFRPLRMPTEPPVRHRDDGLPDNVDRLKALGNAVVPQIPEMFGRLIIKIENGFNYE